MSDPTQWSDERKAAEANRRMFGEAGEAPDRLEPQCRSCAHLIEIPGGARQCPAFASGRIPDAIWLNAHDHGQPYPGDRGIRYEPADPDELATRAAAWQAWRRDRGIA